MPGYDSHQAKEISVIVRCDRFRPAAEAAEKFILWSVKFDNWSTVERHTAAIIGSRMCAHAQHCWLLARRNRRRSACLKKSAVFSRSRHTSAFVTRNNDKTQRYPCNNFISIYLTLGRLFTLRMPKLCNLQPA